MGMNLKAVAYFGLGMAAIAGAATFFGFMPALPLLTKVGVAFTGTTLTIGSMALTAGWKVALAFGSLVGLVSATIAALVSAISSAVSGTSNDKEKPAKQNDAKATDSADQAKMADNVKEFSNVLSFRQAVAPELAVDSLASLSSAPRLN